MIVDAANDYRTLFQLSERLGQISVYGWLDVRGQQAVAMFYSKNCVKINNIKCISHLDFKFLQIYIKINDYQNIE